jgi:hypothetical protein
VAPKFPVFPGFSYRCCIGVSASQLSENLALRRFHVLSQSACARGVFLHIRTTSPSSTRAGCVAMSRGQNWSRDAGGRDCWALSQAGTVRVRFWLLEPRFSVPLQPKPHIERVARSLSTWTTGLDVALAEAVEGPNPELGLAHHELLIDGSNKTTVFGVAAIVAHEEDLPRRHGSKRKLVGAGAGG